MSLNALAPELKQFIAEACTRVSRRNLARTSKEWRAVVRGCSQPHLDTDLLQAFRYALTEPTLAALASRTFSIDVRMRQGWTMFSWTGETNRLHEDTEHAFGNLSKLLVVLAKLQRFSLNTNNEWWSIPREITGPTIHGLLQSLFTVRCSETLVHLALDLRNVTWLTLGFDFRDPLPCDLRPLVNLPVLKILYLRCHVLCPGILAVDEEEEDQVANQNANTNAGAEATTTDKNMPPLALEKLIVNLNWVPLGKTPEDVEQQMTLHCETVRDEEIEHPELLQEFVDAMAQVKTRAPRLQVARTISYTFYAGHYMLVAVDADGVRWVVTEEDWEGGEMLHGPSQELEGEFIGGHGPELFLDKSAGAEEEVGSAHMMEFLQAYYLADGGPQDTDEETGEETDDQDDDDDDDDDDNNYSFDPYSDHDSVLDLDDDPEIDPNYIVESRESIRARVRERLRLLLGVDVDHFGASPEEEAEAEGEGEGEGNGEGEGLDEGEGEDPEEETED